MSELAEQKCQPCEGGVNPLTKQEAQNMNAKLDGWQLSDDAKTISKTFKFKNFLRTMSFVNAVAWIANKENHHPDMHVGYNTCTVQFATHAIGGLSENDFICAAKTDALNQ